MKRTVFFFTLVVIIFHASSLVALDLSDGLSHTVNDDQNRVPYNLDQYSVNQPGTSLTVSEGGKVSYIHAYYWSNVYLEGGNVVQNIILNDNCQGVIESGRLKDLYVWGNSSCIMKGGYIWEKINVNNSGTLYLLGGEIQDIIATSDYGKIYIYGSNFSVNGVSLSPNTSLRSLGSSVLAGTITGTLADGSSLNNKYKIYGSKSADIVILPSPVSNVSALQRDDNSGIVDISYTLIQEASKVELSVSDDGGKTWDVKCSKYSGDIGSNIQSGDRHLIWYSKTDIPYAYGNEYIAKVSAEIAGETYSDITDLFEIKNADGPVITGISSEYCNKNKSVYFIKDVSLGQEFTVMISADGPEASELIWYLGDNAIAMDDVSSNTLSRVFDVGEFGSGEKLSVEAIGEDGSKSARVEANFEVIESPVIVPANYLSVKPTNLGLKYASSTFSLQFPRYDAVLTGEGNVLNPNQSGIEEIASTSFDTIVEVSADISGDGICNISIKSDKLGMKKDDALKIAGISFDALVWTDIVLRYEGSWTPGGAIGCEVSAGKKFTPKYYVVPTTPPIPIFINGSANATVSGNLSLTGFGGNEGFLYTGELSPSAALELIFGVGISEVISGEGYLKGSTGLIASFSNMGYPEIGDHYLALDGGLRAYFFVYKWEQQGFHFRLPEENTKKTARKSISIDMLEPMSRKYITQDYAQWYGSNSSINKKFTKSNQVNEETTLQTNIFSQSNPKLAISGNTKCLVWLYDDPYRNSLDRTMLVYSINNGSGWSEPAAIDNDGTADATPCLIVDHEGDFRCVWANASHLIPDDTDIIGLSATLDIKMAVYDNTLDIWRVETVCDSSAMDYMPKVMCEGDGNITIVWAHDDNSDMVGQTLPVTNYLMGRTKTSNGWLDTEILSSGNGLINSITVQTDKDSNYIVYSLDRDGDIQTDGDNDLVYLDNTSGTWSVPIFLTDEQEISNVNPYLIWQSSDLMLLWSRNGQIASTTNILDMTGIQYVVDQAGSSGQRAFVPVVSSSGNISVIWHDASLDGSDIYAATYDPLSDSWSNENQITHSRDMEQSVTAVYSESDVITLAYNKREIIDDMAGLDAFGRVDLCTYEYTILPDIAVAADSLSVVEDEVAPGDTVMLQAEIKNNGDISAGSISVAFYLGDSPNTYTLIDSQVVIDDNLAAGESVIVSTNWTIPQDGQPIRVWVVADPDNQILDKDYLNNSSSIDLYRSNLTVNEVEVCRTESNTFEVKVGLVNTGFAATTESFEVRLVDSNDYDNILFSQAVQLPAVEQSRILTFEVPYALIPADYFALDVVLDSADTIAESNERDNIRTVLLNNNLSDQAGSQVVDDLARTFSGYRVDIDVLANDKVNVLQVSTLSISSGSENATLVSDVETGVISYIPNELFSGTDSFKYSVKDNNGTIYVGSVTVIVGDVYTLDYKNAWPQVPDAHFHDNYCMINWVDGAVYNKRATNSSNTMYCSRIFGNQYFNMSGGILGVHKPGTNTISIDITDFAICNISGGKVACGFYPGDYGMLIISGGEHDANYDLRVSENASIYLVGSNFMVNDVPVFDGDDLRSHAVWDEASSNYIGEVTGYLSDGSLFEKYFKISSEEEGPANIYIGSPDVIGYPDYSQSGDFFWSDGQYHIIDEGVTGTVYVDKFDIPSSGTHVTVMSGASSNQSLYLYNNATADMSEGSRISINAYDNTSVDMSGGFVRYLNTFDNVTINVANGSIGRVNLFGNSEMYFSGGFCGVGYDGSAPFSTYDNSTCVVTGGSLNTSYSLTSDDLFSACNNSTIIFNPPSMDDLSYLPTLRVEDDGRIVVIGHDMELTNFSRSLGVPSSGDKLSDYTSSGSISVPNPDTNSYRRSKLVAYFDIDTRSAGKRGNGDIYVIDNAPEVNVYTGQAIKVDVLGGARETISDIVSGSTIVILSGPEHGSVEVDSETGLIVYVSDSGFSGEDAIIYTVDNNAGTLSYQGTLTVDVTEPLMFVQDVKIQVGKDRLVPKDTITVKGVFERKDALQNSLAHSESIIVSIRDTNKTYYTETIAINPADLNRNILNYIGSDGAISKLVIDASKYSYQFQGKSLQTMSGLTSPIEVELNIGGSVFVSQADESIINGNKDLPVLLQSGVCDSIDLTKVQIGGKNSDVMSLQGTITAADNSLDLSGDIEISWDDFTETVSLVRKNSTMRQFAYRLDKKTNPAGVIQSIAIDLDKCTFKISAKGYQFKSTFNADFGISQTSGDFSLRGNYQF